MHGGRAYPDLRQPQRLNQDNKKTVETLSTVFLLSVLIAPTVSSASTVLFQSTVSSNRTITLGAPSLTAAISDDTYILTHQQRLVNTLTGVIFIFGRISASILFFFMYLLFCPKSSQDSSKLLLSFGRSLFSLLFTFFDFSHKPRIASRAFLPPMRK